MQEIIEYLKANTEQVEGVQMVPYAIAVEGLQIMIDNLSIDLIEQSLTEIYEELEKIDQQDDSIE